MAEMLRVESEQHISPMRFRNEVAPAEEALGQHVDIRQFRFTYSRSSIALFI